MKKAKAISKKKPARKAPAPRKASRAMAAPVTHKAAKAPAKKTAATKNRKAATARSAPARTKVKAAPAARVTTSTTSKSTTDLQLSLLTAAAFSRDGKTLAVAVSRAGGQASVRVFHVDNGATRARCEVDIGGAAIDVLAVSPRGSSLALGRPHLKGVHIIDVATATARHTLNVAPPSCLAFAPDGERLAVGVHHGADFLALVVDAKGGEELFRSTPYRAPLSGLSFLPDGLVLTGVADDSGDVIAWDVDAARELLRMGHGGEGAAVSRPARAVATSADGLRVAVSAGARVDVWSVHAQKCSATINVDRAPDSIALNADGTVLYVGAPHAGAWSVASGARLGSLDGPGVVVAHPDNHHLFVSATLAPGELPELTTILDRLYPTHDE